MHRPAYNSLFGKRIKISACTGRHLYGHVSSQTIVQICVGRVIRKLQGIKMCIWSNTASEDKCRFPTPSKVYGYDVLCTWLCISAMYIAYLVGGGCDMQY